MKSRGYLMKMLMKAMKECDSAAIPYGEIADIKINNRAKTRWGQCKKLPNDEYEIQVSSRLLEDEVSDMALMNTLLHELCHTCYGCMNHGKKWKEYAARLNKKGYSIQRCTSAEEKNITLDESCYRYSVKCENCGSEWKYMKRGAVIKALMRDPQSCKCSCGSHNFRLMMI